MKKKRKQKKHRTVSVVEMELKELEATTGTTIEALNQDNSRLRTVTNEQYNELGATRSQLQKANWLLGKAIIRLALHENTFDLQSNH